MKTGRYNIKELLTHNEIEQIIIPEIQRDYVWKSKNVLKLLESITKNFVDKKEANLVIEIDGKKVTNLTINSYLEKEYKKLLYNTKIGFIYAYHDNEYAGKFFLIDGQQRFTTIYLLLLAIYVKNKKQQNFKTVYFQNNILKIDYKVRENSHEFMTNFITNELEEQSKDITLSVKYYKNEYEKDETIKNLINNYKVIQDFIEKNSEKFLIDDCYDDFEEYVEDYIEVNYFDTNISEQGEQLYLYMNSRGEFLSHQEKLKSEIIKKEVLPEDKKQIGRKWEEWQNFFWKNRGYNYENANENADIGFEEFLKWCTIIHICTTEKSEEYLVFENLKDRKQTTREAKENYINRVKEKVENQKEYLNNYQNIQLTADYISQNFDAIVFLSNLELKFVPISLKWFYQIDRTLDYVQLLPLLYFITNSKWNDESQKLLDVKRLAMLLKNTTYFLSISKNPDSATIDALELIKSMCDGGQTDIVYFLNSNYSGKFKTILTPNILKTLGKFEEYEQRDKLENIVWGINLNQDLNLFLKGDTSILFRTTEYYISNYETKLNYHELLEKFYNILIAILENYEVYRNGSKSDVFRQALLTFGDYTVPTNGCNRFGNRIEGCSFGYSEINSDNTEMTEIFQSEKDNLIKMMIALYENPKFYLELIIENYTANDIKDWKYPFIKIPQILKYCNKKRILWENDRRIILISEKDKGYVELQCKLLQTIYKKYKIKISNFNICEIAFDVVRGKLIQQKDAFKIIIKYQNKEWKYVISTYNEDSQKDLQPFIDGNLGILINNEIIPNNALIYTDDDNISILENIDNLNLIVDKLILQIETTIKL